MTGCATSHAEVMARRHGIDRVEERALARLYRAGKGAKRQIEAAVGHGVFRCLDVDMLLIGGGLGRGVVVDHQTDERTYMRLAGASLGFGLGVRDFRVVFVFWTESALRDFIERGLDIGAEAQVTAELGIGFGFQQNVVVTARKGVTMFQFTERGVALRADLSANKFWRHAVLNAPAAAR